MPEAPFPRLLYIGDVPVEASYHGSALLYRLLQDHPADRLRIMEAGLSRSLANRRLPGVEYAFASAGTPRLLNTRFHRWYSLWLSLRSRAHVGSVAAQLAGFTPEAVVTVAHGYSWVTAAAFASLRNVPLHLIVHDDWPRIMKLPGVFSNRVERQFVRVYRQAASRLCVSPFMVEEYRRRYGVDARVLYPSRARDTPIFEAPPERLGRTCSALTFAFAGTINIPDYCRLLRMLAELLEARGGRVLIFGPLTTDQAAAAGLTSATIELRGLLPSDQLMKRLRAEVDVLFVPMSFAERDKANMEVSFPSKLTDYTAVGLPLLIVGPSYCSAVRWARENYGVAEVVDVDEPARLRAAVGRLSNADYRVQLASRALSVGARQFSNETARQQLLSALGA